MHIAIRAAEQEDGVGFNLPDCACALIFQMNKSHEHVLSFIRHCLRCRLGKSKRLAKSGPSAIA